MLAQTVISSIYTLHCSMSFYLKMIYIIILLGQVTLTVAIYTVCVCIVMHILSASDAAHCSLWIALVLRDQVMEELRSPIPCCQINTEFTILKFIDIKGHAA